MIPGQLEPTALPNLRVSGDNAAPAVQQMMDKPLGQANDVATQEADKVNTATTNEAYGHLVQLKNEMTYGENGVLTKKGADAQNLKAVYTPAWEKGVDDVTKDLTAQQKLMLAPAIKNEGAEFNSLVGIHEHQERHNYAISSSLFAQKNIQDDAIRNYNRAPDKVAGNIALAQAENNTLAKLNGWSGDEVKQKNRESADYVHGGIVSQLRAEGQYLSAEDYLNKNQKDMDSKTYDGMRGVLANTDLPFQQGYNALTSTNGKGTVDPQIYDRLDPDQKKALDRTKQILTNGTAPVTDPATKTKLLTLAQDAQGNYQQKSMFLNTNLDQYFPDLNPQDMAQIKGIQDDMRKGGTGGKVLQNKSETDKILNTAYDQLGILHGDDSKGLRDKLSLQVSDWIDQTEANTGKYPTNDEKKQYVASQIKEQIVSGSRHWYNFNSGESKPSFELDPDEKPEDQPVQPGNTKSSVNTGNNGAETVKTGNNIPPPNKREIESMKIELAQKGYKSDDASINTLWKNRHAR